MSVIPGGLNPEFERRLKAMEMALPPGMSFRVTSGLRTYAEQASLYANRATNPNPVAPPGTSAHENIGGVGGRAVDLRFGSPATEAWIRANAGGFGLAFPHTNDPVHMEMSRRTEVNIGSISVNAPNARDARGVAQAIAPEMSAAMRRQLALSANGGAN
jgi:hypothetical protein